MKVDLTCPLELWEYRLPSKDSPECVLTLFNLENRTISSMQISLTALDARGEVLSNHTERPMALSAQGKQSFELRFAMSEGEEMDSLSLLFEKVWFDDGTVWRRASSAQLTEYSPNEMEQGRELENLRYVAGPDAVGYPDDQGRVWMCVCGRANAEDEDTCRRCGRSREYIFINDTHAAVKDSIAARERELEQKGQKALEESSRQELLKQAALRRRVSSHKHRWVGAAIASALIVALYFSMALLLPEITYARAAQTLAAGSPLTAKEMFESLLDYRDALNQVLECDYVYAEQLLAKGDMDGVTQAQSLFESLGSYKDSAARVRESRYSQAALFLRYSEYEMAGELFAALGDYLDSREQYRLSSYMLAKRMMTAQQYAQAAELFSQLEGYEDSSELAAQCVYRSATAAMAASRFDEASGLYASIPDYQDALSRAQEALYSAGNAYLAAKDFASAASRFKELGEYRDSIGKWKESTYAAAARERDLAHYSEALSLFIEIKDYQDSADQILACSYEPARAFMASGEYEQAALLLSAMPDYKDSAELLNQCVYLPAMDLFSAEKWREAIALFERIPDYKDSAEMADKARYSIAADMYASGERVEAAEAFEALGGFDDAADRARFIRYTLADEAFAAGDYATAQAGFAALDDYDDSAERAKECAYETAMLIKAGGDLQGAYDALSAIKDYPKAAQAAGECVYQMALNALGTGDLPRAAELFLKAGNYQDARARYEQTVYDEALNWMERMDYQRAGELFDSVSSFSDAKAKSAECYDLWLADRLDEAREMRRAGQLQEAIDLLGGLPIESLPGSYSEMRSIYEECNLIIADRLIDEGRQLEAWAYLQNAGGSAEAKRLRERRVYQILGEWISTKDERFAFADDGTAVLAGESGYYFNVINYGLMTGGDPGDLAQTYRILNYTAKTLSLQDNDGKTIRLTRSENASPASADDTGGAVLE
ncbi:MAG: hypothetical protein LBH66_07280 [Oscillospiraceae bacterium]|jgi:tetratricopeptide (TPR) repeat protein|nr:hypothetical protein [Oscillospiraceae bacterium]